MNDASNMIDGIESKTDVDDVPTVAADQHKLLANLSANAIQALLDSETDSKTLALEIRTEVRISSVSVRDNGVGVSDENLNKLFTHGFTTRKARHGPGLHSSACV